jgi:hypothetical protein
MDIEAPVKFIKSLVVFVIKHRAQVLYPCVPFIFVPALLASLIVLQFGTNPAYYPDDRPATVDMPVKVSRNLATESHATLLVLPTASEFFLGGSGKGIESIWLSMDPRELVANSGRVTLRSGGLDMTPLRGVDYPLIMVINGEHEHEIVPGGRKRQALSHLQLTTPLSTWVVFFLLGGAVFGFGASISFIGDRAVIDEPEASV